MLPGLVLCILFLGLVYGYINYQKKFEATASAIRQIWSGSCHLSCRRSEYSDFSGYSRTLYQGQFAPRVERPDPGGCICQTCPCELIENVLRTCRPATDLYTYVVYTISEYICFFMSLLITTYTTLSGAIQCRTACRRQAQLSTSSKFYESEKNFSFTEKNSESSIQSSSATEKQVPSKTSMSAEAGSSKSVDPKISQQTLKPDNSKNPKQLGCVKCVERGKTCMKECPHAKKRMNNY